MNEELIQVLAEISESMRRIASSLDSLEKKGVLMWIGEQKPEDN